MFRKVFILGIFISFVFGQLARIQIGQGIAFTFLDLTVLFFFIGNIVNLTVSKRNGVIVRHELGKPILFFALSCMLSLLINVPVLGVNDAIIAALYLLRYFMYSSIIFFLPFFSKSERKLTILSLSAGTLLTVIIGYVQFFYYPNLRNLFYLGWDDHLYRLFSVFLDPNFTSVLFALLSLLLLGSFLDSLQGDFRKRGVIGVLFFFVTLAIFLTYSRTGMITLATGVIVLLWIKGYKLLLLGCISLFLIFLALTSNVKVEGLNPFRTASSSARVESMRIALAISSKSPIFGVGFNAYRYAQHKYGFRANGAWETSHADAGTDNSFLFVLATTGIIGLSSYLYLWFVLLRTSYRVSKKAKDFFSAVVFSSLIAVLASSLFLNTLFYPFILVWILGLYGVMGRSSP